MDEVDFPDTDQEKAVRIILGSMGSSDKIKLNELAAVTELAIVGNMYAPDLEHTAFTHQGECQVNGTKPLEGKVQDLSVIGKMAFLERLALVYQPLSDVKALNGLVMLNELYLSGDRALISLTVAEQPFGAHGPAPAGDAAPRTQRRPGPLSPGGAAVPEDRHRQRGHAAPRLAGDL